jgi:hypothetical protein
MSNIIPLKFRKRQHLASVLGLALDGSRLDGVVLRRANGSVQVQQAFSVSLSLDPLTAAPELVGREIRNHLDAAGIRERACVVGLPLKWALTTHVDVPQLPAADVESFLAIEAERGFPCDIATLQVASSRCALEKDKQYALLVGIPKNHLGILEKVLRAARLKPVSFSLGIAALQPAHEEASQGVLALIIGEAQVGLQLTAGGGVAALRALEGALEVEGGRRQLNAEIVARETRITLGQLPTELREKVRRIRILGPRDLAQQLADELELRCESLGITVELATTYADREFGLRLPKDTVISPPFSLAAGVLTERRIGFEFLPPRVSTFQRLSTRYSSGRLGMAGAAAVAVLLIVIGMFLYQQFQLSRYRSQWNAMASKVHELEGVQSQIREYRPWYDESVRGLTILRQLTQAFPEDGVVSAKSVEIREFNTITCSGLTKDYQALLKTLDRLRATSGITEVRLSMIRGKSPMQFTFDFHWTEGGASEH